MGKPNDNKTTEEKRSQPPNNQVPQGVEAVYPLEGQDYAKADALCALAVLKLALEDGTESVIHRALVRIECVLVSKPQTASENEIRFLGVARRGLAAKLLDIRRDADRKTQTEVETPLISSSTGTRPKNSLSNAYDPFEFPFTPKWGNDRYRSLRGI